MKLSLLRSIATHLLGVAAGGALAYVTMATPPPEDDPDPPKHRPTSLSARFSPTVTLELERLMEQAEAKRPEADPDRLPTIREELLAAIEEQPEIDRHQEEELLRLRALARNFVEVKDLHPVLTDALVAEDRDTARALFLEWRRRDPAAAFDALAVRGDWTASFDEVLALAVSNHELVAQAARSDRPEAFRDKLLTRLAAKLGGADDLRGMATALDHLDPRHHRRFLGVFTETWIPDQEAEAARFVGLDLKPDQQRQFLEALAGVGYARNPTPLPDGFATALLQYDLHIPRDTYEILASNAAHVDHPIDRPLPGPSGSPGIDFDSTEAVDAFQRALDRPLHHQRDFPDLFAAGSITLDEIATAMQGRIPGAEKYPDAFARALFLKLAPHDPARAIIWAHTTIHPNHLDEDITTVLHNAIDPDLPREFDAAGDCSIWGSGYEPRTRRLANLVTVLQPAQMDDPSSKQTAMHLLHDFHEWSRLSPDDARPTLDHIAPGHPIWKHDEPRNAGP